MDNIVSLSPALIGIMAQTLTKASERGARVRVCTGTDRNGRKWLKWDAGSGWTAPQYTDEPCRSCEYLSQGKWDGAVAAPHTCGLPNP